MRKFLKILLFIFCFLLAAVSVLVIWLNTDSGKNFVRKQALSYLRGKLKTVVEIDKLGYGLPKYINLEGVLVKDQNSDTLLYVGKLKIDLDMWGLIHKRVDVQEILLEDATAHIGRRAHDTEFNFSYIIAAFAGPTTNKPRAKKSDSAAALKIDVNLVKMDNIHFKMDDSAGGNLLAFSMEHLNLKMKRIDLDSMLFHVKDLEMSGVVTSFLRDTSYLKSTHADTSTTNLRLMADKVALQHIDVHYKDKISKILFDAGVGDLEASLQKLDLGNELIAVKSFGLNNTRISLKMGMQTKVAPKPEAGLTVSASKGWTVAATKVSLSNVNYAMDDDNSTPTKEGIDYAHMDARGIALQAENIYYGGDTVNGIVKHLALKEQRGFVLNELKTEFKYNDQGAVLNGLYLQTPNTLIQNHAEVHYASIDSVIKNPASMLLHMDLQNCTVGIADVLQFAPFLKGQEIIRKNKNGSLKLDAVFSGPLNDLDINMFKLSGIEQSEIDVTGSLRGLPDANRVSYNFNIARLSSNKKLLMYFVTPDQVSSVNLPDYFNIKGAISGTSLNYNPDLHVSTSDGDIALKGYLYLQTAKGKEKYDLALNAINFDAGKVFKQDSVMGKLSVTVSVKGTGFDPKTMNSTVSGNIKSATFKNYPYSGITFNGEVVEKKGNLKMVSNDPRASMQLTGHADFNGDYVAAVVDAMIDSIDFKELNLYKDELRIHGKLHADFPVLNPDYPVGVFTWTDPVITVNGQRFVPDSILIASRPSADTGQNIYVYADLLQASITGKIPLTKIPLIIEDQIQRRYHVWLSDSIKKQIVAKVDTANLAASYNLNLAATLTDKPIIHAFVPKLLPFDPVNIKADASESKFTFSATVPNFGYDSSILQKGDISVTGNDSAINYQVSADHIGYSKFDFWNADVHGRIDPDSIATSISLSDVDKNERFALAATILQHLGNKIIELRPGLVLEYNKWQVAPLNSITVNDSGYFINNLLISLNEQSIKLNSERQVPNAPIRADIKDFQLRNIASFISKSDTALVAGKLSGYATYSSNSEGMTLDSKLDVQNLMVLNDTLGNLTAEVKSTNPQTLDTKLGLKGQGNEIAITGNYYPQQLNGQDFDLVMNLKSVNLHSFETIAGGKITNSTGQIKGDLKIQGTISAPIVTGELTTDELKTTVTDLDGTFKMPKENISFKDGAVSFSDFKILDSAGNKAVVDGSVDIKDLGNPVFDLNVVAKNWRAVHSKPGEKKIFFGDLYLTSDLNIKGTPSAPVVDGSLAILKGSDFTVVTPETNPELENTEGIVVFKKMQDSNRYNVLALHKKDSLKSRPILATGSVVNVNITIDKKAQLSLVLDQSTGDFIKVRGTATLNTYIMPDGTVGLTGNYELNEGAYQLNYNFIKRKFLIKDGSTIVFAGDPVDGTNLDVTAVYSANIAPFDLVEKEIQDPVQLNYYKQRLPFDVELHMRGSVMKPSLTFDIILPDNKVYPLSADQIELIHGKLNQLHNDTSQLNKQVFAVLLLSRFVADDPFSSAASTSVSNTALQSVSRFIGEQLNQVAGKLVKGVDLSVDLATTDDYTTGDLRQRTDLNLAASKRLMNDRLKLTLGNDFELDGPQGDKSSQNNLIPSNLSADYSLTTDGRYTLRGYRKNYNEGVLQGYVTESGLDFIVTFDYDDFKAIFKTKGNTNQ